MEKKIQKVLETVPTLYRGPGGAVAVLKDGEIVGEHIWGFADLDQRILMTKETRMPICSITKQMLCQVVIDLERKPTRAMAGHSGPSDIWSRLSEAMAELLPQELTGQKDNELKVVDLCHNQSGIRDYWAMSTLWGAKPDERFAVAKDGVRMRQRLKSFHFKPGTQYSYANTNFHILARLVENVSKESIENLLAERIFAPAGMTTARLCADTARQPPPCIGYEGDEQHGFQAAVNRIEWSGDAGVVATLADMIAYEQYLDRSWSDPSSVYRKVSEAQHFRDNSLASYGWGLGRGEVGGVATLGHGGALRGYRLHRIHAPEKRLSVVVMLNHEADAEGVALHILKQALNLPEEPVPNVDPLADWVGGFLDENKQLAITVSNGGQSEVLISYAGYPEPVKLTDASHARSASMVASVNKDLLTINRLEDHTILNARRLAAPVETKDGSEIHGEYRCAEIDSTFHCSGDRHMLYGWFEGFLGEGSAHLMRHLGEDVWVLACPRGMDAPAPGDWTMVFTRNKDGVVVGVTVGCWLARGLDFSKML